MAGAHGRMTKNKKLLSLANLSSKDGDEISVREDQAWKYFIFNFLICDW